TFTNGEGETEVGIFAMRRELLRNHLHFVAGLDLEPAAVQAGPLALYNALKYDGICGAEPIAILDIGTQNSDLIVAEGGSLWTRNIPIGGNAFTDALSKTFKVSFRKAENLKRDAAKNKYARQIFQAMRPVFADLVAEVQRSIGFYTSSHRGVKLDKMVAMGGAFKLPGLQKFLQQNLGMDVVRPAAFSKLTATTVPNLPVFTENLMGFGVAYGLALQGLGQATIRTNLLPPEIAKQVIWRKKTPWFYGAAACLVLSAMVVWGRNFHDSSAVTQAQAATTPPALAPTYGQADAAKENPLLNPQARDVLNASSPKGETAIEKAKWVVAAADGAKQVVTKLQSANQALIEEAQEAATSNSQKAVWPAVLKMIHSAVPRDAKLDEAMRKGPDEFKAFVESDPKNYARPERKQVFITSISAQYSTAVMSDFNTLLAQKKGLTGATTGGGGGATGGHGPGASAAPVAAAGPGKEGFVIALSGRTPNAGGFDFLRKTFFDTLSKAKEGKEVYVQEVQLVDCQTAEKMEKTPANIGSGRGGSTGGGMAGGTGTGGKAQPKIDPVTKEPMQNDHVFEVLIAVEFGEKEATSAAGSGASPTTPGAPARPAPNKTNKN
ncbi:MAG: pilus assembly protein PilM, partial [Phycisphaerae bacterium]|nr:pilus assembly protein PilM [Phycisphaerae bacterium]